MQNVDNKREREKVMVSVHCYQPQMREQIRQVMRYSGQGCCSITRSWQSDT